MLKKMPAHLAGGIVNLKKINLRKFQHFCSFLNILTLVFTLQCSKIVAFHA